MRGEAMEPPQIFIWKQNKNTPTKLSSKKWWEAEMKFCLYHNSYDLHLYLYEHREKNLARQPPNSSKQLPLQIGILTLCISTLFEYVTKSKYSFYHFKQKIKIGRNTYFFNKQVADTT